MGVSGRSRPRRGAEVGGRAAGRATSCWPSTRRARRGRANLEWDRSTRSLNEWTPPTRRRPTQPLAHPLIAPRVVEVELASERWRGDGPTRSVRRRGRLPGPGAGQGPERIPRPRCRRSPSDPGVIAERPRYLRFDYIEGSTRPCTAARPTSLASSAIGSLRSAWAMFDDHEVDVEGDGADRLRRTACCFARRALRAPWRHRGPAVEVRVAWDPPGPGARSSYHVPCGHHCA
jgi:hypothetical protein